MEKFICYLFDMDKTPEGEDKGLGNSWQVFVIVCSILLPLVWGFAYVMANVGWWIYTTFGGWGLIVFPVLLFIVAVASALIRFNESKEDE